MKTMTEKYVPSWERNYDKWETEPEYWENEIEETETNSEEIPLDFVDEKDLAFEIDESEFDLDFE